MTENEIEQLFKYVTKTVKTIGVEISINRLTEKVFSALDALLIEKMKDAITKSLKPLSELFSRHDANKDGKLGYDELENLLLECQVAFKPNMLDRIYALMDANKKTSKISYETLKFFLTDGGKPIELG